MSSLRDLCFALCSHEVDILRAQRIMGSFILITHKSTRSKIRWGKLSSNAFPSWRSSEISLRRVESYHTKKGVSQEVTTAWWAAVAYLTCSRFQSLLNVSFPGPFYVLKIKPAKPVLCGQALLRFSLILFSFSCLGGGYLCRAQKVSEVWLVHKSSW